ncbi:glycosyltransferase [Stappia sp. GBMRC 2046]|uniref:Glycosyltransferase n=1 Tax=Stappia sediminis TaxID=2692190 RepID=A0A7X3LSM4_9HYPH|nr:glycosyltransferase [Stappia sediminis]MXN64354.1 glycosyltransferase [Stappia sediminis]
MTFETPEVFTLASGVCLVVWDLQNRAWTSPRLEERDGGKLSPVACVRLARNDGGTRLLWVFRNDANKTRELRASAGAIASETDIHVPQPDDIAFADPRTILKNLSLNGRAAMISALLNTWPGIFKLGRSRSFTEFVLRLLGELSEDPPLAACSASVGATRIIETRLDAGCDTVLTASLVTGNGVMRIGGSPCILEESSKNRHPVILLAEMPVLPKGGYLVLTGPWGLAVRKLDFSAAGQSLVQWWNARKPRNARLRDYVVSVLGSRSRQARSAVVEMQLADPLPARRVSGEGRLSSLAVEVALGGENGVLVGGWMHDPIGMVEAIDLIDTSGVSHTLELNEFPGVLPEEQGAQRVTCFAAFAPVANSFDIMLQPRFEARFASGARHSLIPPPQPSDLNEIRRRMLSIVPPQHLADGMLESCLAPALSSIQHRIRASVGRPKVSDMGVEHANPQVSIVIPLYRELGFLKAQFAALATDPWISANAELIYVLDSPEQAGDVEDLLGSFHLLFGQSVKLAVMERNAGYAMACNAGARVARGRYIAMLNSDAIPAKAGWLSLLAACLQRDEGIGVAGAKLLYEDNAIQHAGLHFIQNQAGKWFNHHYFKGFPRHFADANAERQVPAVTGACLVVERKTYEAVEGFTEDYVIGDYEDSDLCLKVRRSGQGIAYVPEAELYHFERRSIRKNADYTRGVASQYNRWLHQCRWEDEIKELMTAPDGASRGKRVAA